MSYYAANPHYAADDFSAQRAREAAADFEASRWFNDLTKPQTDRFNQRMADIAPYKGAPRWTNEREAAMREFYETTKEAAEICEMVRRDMLATGEVSEATSCAFDELMTRQTMAVDGARAEFRAITEAAIFPRLPSYEEALQNADAARTLFDASKGGNVRGITEDHRFQLVRVFGRLRLVDALATAQAAE
ncbi:hypothetical protein J6524_04985 [Bradyrhizobium sp. WSM 1738]|uniref:hypothetical protein n=1 Tax=Bradyrhizobium hereditatis TaxID=2821405 RepID=UPI001CE2AB50|nr:hypothetical protein [Bradyrhizobium hereditatis]MCA6114284.1 hypothetical protein [Bradyrhizobium hereditatis]